MGHIRLYPKLVKRFPRKLKKQIKKIPVGSYCYGSAIGDKGRMINKELVQKTISCPFHTTYFCKFLKQYDDTHLPDATKICNNEKYDWLIEP